MLLADEVDSYLLLWNILPGAVNGSITESLLVLAKIKLPLCLKMSKRQKYLANPGSFSGKFSLPIEDPPSRSILSKAVAAAELRKFGCGHGYNHRRSMCSY